MEEENKAGLSGWRLKLNVVLHTRVIHRANFSASNMGDFCQEQEHQLEDIMLPRTKKDILRILHFLKFCT